MKRSAAIALSIALTTTLTGVGAGPALAANKNKNKAIAIAEVRKHNKPTDCWTVINKRVYNLTKWVSQHPGGSAAISRLCGTDGTRAFSGKHAGDSGPMSQLAKYQIGVLR